MVHSDKFGTPRQLAYKLDTLVINKQIDLHRSLRVSDNEPLPRYIRLGSLNDVCRELDIKPGGRTKKEIAQALKQNAAVQINATLSYIDRHGIQHTLNDFFSRYAVRFTGQKLPNGEKSDAIYIVLNEVYWNVLNNAQVRPLDYDYL